MKERGRNTIFDIVLGAAVALFATALYLWIIPNQIELRTSWSDDVIVDSRTFPYIIAICLFVVGVYIAIKGIVTHIKMREMIQAQATEKQGKTYRDYISLIVFVAILLYVLAFQFFGFLIATVIFIPLCMFILQTKKISYYIVTYVFVFAVAMLFHFFLNVRIF